ncbi:adenylate kinase 7-like isoform X2 [Periplaneta americana]|uniref:adenylate kinase 7-like isoform X2 n=1 Tax=Periplaneta americana TaxID=6978 RepID=UPI0037E7DB9E
MEKKTSIVNGESKTASAQDLVSNRPKSQKSLDLDDLFGFTEARKKLERRDEDKAVEPDFVPYRIFLNNLDSYLGRYMSEFLSDQVFGGLKSQDEGEEQEPEDIEEEEKLEEDEENIELNVKENAKNETKESLKNNYEIIGTVKNSEYRKTESIKSIIDSSNREEFLPIILKCGFIIYNISEDNSQISEAYWTMKAIEAQLDKMKEEEPKAFEAMKDIRHFILISTIMTWALTKPIDPHKEKFKTLVIATGVTYGKEEDILHAVFKMAWENPPSLPVILPGKNLIPLIHIMDLASVLHNILEKFPKKQRYILAIEMVVSKLKKIMKVISTTLANGECRNIQKEEAFLIPEISQQLYDVLTVNLNMQPMYIVENMDLKWVSELGFVDNIQQIVTEYREANKLKPLKIFIHGPPAVGKTIIAKRLCSYYQLHYLCIQDVVQAAIAELKQKVEKAKEKDKEEKLNEDQEDEEEVEEEEEEEEQDNFEEISDLLAEIEANIQENNGQLDENYVIRFLKEKMISNPCQNQGYVLDGYPTTIENARALFQAEDDEEEETAEEEEEGGGEVSFNKKIMPEYVISLDATDDVLYSHVMDLPAEEFKNNIYSEENMISRVAEFRKINTNEDTVLNYFDELEVHPFLLDVTNDTSLYMEKTFKIITDKIGKPRNYGSRSGEDDEFTKQEKLIKKNELLKQARKEELIRRAIEEQRAKMEEWANLLNALKEEEEELLAIQGMPARHYLMRYIFPTLTRGLLEVAHIRPEDPVDYLAEYLFRENPEGKMFQPDYAEAAEDLMNAVQLFKDSLIKADTLGTTDSNHNF